MRHSTRHRSRRREEAEHPSAPRRDLFACLTLHAFRFALLALFMLAPLRALAANQPPTISDVGILNVTYFDDSTFRVFFNGNTISDPDGDLVSVTVIVSPASAASFAGTTFSVSPTGNTNISTFQSAADATTHLRGANFDPNPVSRLTNVQVTLRLWATDQGGLSSPTSTVSLVIVPRLDNPPTVSFGSPGPTNVNDKGTSLPFQRINIDDPDNGLGDKVRVQISFPDERGVFNNAALIKSINGGIATYELAARDPSSAQTFMRSLVFNPAENRITTGSSEVTTFAVTVIDFATRQASDTIDLTVVAVNDPPTIIGATDTTTTDKLSVTPFSWVTLEDVDNGGAQQLSLTVSLDDTNKGTFPNYATLGFSKTGTNYTTNGTASALTTVIRQLVFKPTENRLPVGSVETTTFRIAINDGVASPVQDNMTTVAATSVNDAPTVTGVSATHQQATTGNSVTPFAAATIIDVDQSDDTNRFGQSLTLTVTMTGANLTGQLEGPGGFAGTTFVASDVNGPEATALLHALVYRAPTLPISGTNTLGFTITVTDGHGGSATDANAAVDVYTLTAAPTLFGTRTGQHVNDNTTIAPFSTVSVQSSNGTPVGANIQLDNDVKGQLINLSGFTKLSSTTPATYAATGSVDQITAALHALAFQPTPNRLKGDATETVVFTIVLSSSGKTSSPDSSTTVIVAPVNDRPAITGITPSATIQDNTTIRPFPNVLISDPDESGNQSSTVRVALDFPANGSFAPASLSIFVATNGGYVASGTPGQISTAIHQLVFVPTNALVPVGLSTNIVFSIVANDRYGGVTTNNGTVVLVAAVSGAPLVSVPSQQPLSLALVTPLRPLALVTISAAQNLRVTVAVPEIAGVFSSNSLAANLFTNTSPGSYLFIGSAANATAAIQNLEFFPNTNLVVGTVIRFTITAADPTPNSYTATLDIRLRQTQRSHIVTKTSDYLPGATDAEKFGTLRKAVEDASPNDHITFDLRSPDPNQSDYPRTVRLAQTIVLEKTLAFDGPGADLLTIAGDDTNGLPAVRLFAIQPGVSATINRLTLTKGFDSFSGGAIEVNEGASLKLSYCAITDSTAGLWGGAIDVNGGTLSMDHCLVHGNSTSRSLGQGGGGISLYTDKDCSIVNTTFSADQQLASGGLGGGALYVENSDPGHEMDVFVTSCTFSNNIDAGGSATSIRPNVFDANVFVQNCIFSDGQGYNLYLDGSGMIFSLGGNISDDSTRTIFSIGGASYDIVILDGSSDRTNKPAGLLPLGANGGPTRTFALAGLSAAINGAVSNETGATFFNTLGTDQRGFWRRDGQPDIGAFERNATNRIIIEEIMFAPAPPNTSDEFIEFYVPRDSGSLNLAGYQVYVGGALRHTFASQVVGPGQALVLFSKDAVNTSVPSGVSSLISNSRLDMDNNADTITLKNPFMQTVFELSYVGAFVSSDTNISRLLTNANQSLVLSPQFQGQFLPYQVVAQKEGGPGGRTNDLAGPGLDVGGNPLGGGNSPPRAFNDAVATDARTPLLAIPVRSNDLELDASDVLRVVGLGVTNGFPSGAAGIIIPPGETTLTSTSLWGATVMMVSNGAAIFYDPNTSAFLKSLPQGSNFVDSFQYTILDSSNGVDQLRGATTVERSNNIVKATATVGVTVTGVNSPPTPQPDSVTTNPLLSTTEDAVLDFTTLNNLLANDTDPNTDDQGKLKIVAVHPTATFSNTVQMISALGAVVTLDIRFNPAQTHITYDPRPSAILTKLSTNQFLVDTFYYAVMDTHGAVGSTKVDLKVWGTNDVSVANPDQVAGKADTILIIPPSTLLGNDADPDTNDVKRIVSVSTPSLLGARVVFNGTNVIYDSSTSSNFIALARKEIATDSFTYVMTDGAGGFSTSSVTVVVTGVNERPVAAAYTKTIDEDTPLTVSATGVFTNSYDPDVNGHAPDDVIRILPFTNRLTTAGASVTLHPDGSYRFDPRIVFDWLPVNSNSVDSFTYTLLDGSLTMANDDQFTVQINSLSVSLPVLANDVALAGTGGNDFITGVSVPTQGGTVSTSATGDALIYTPAVNYSGFDTFSYSISDGQGGTDTAQVTVLVTANAINANLIANSDWFTVSRGTTVDLNVLANDNILPASGSTLTILSIGPTSNGGVAVRNGTGLNNSITYTPNPTLAVPFTDTFSYVISGNGPVQATGTVTITVVTNVVFANDDNFSILAESGTNVLEVLANDLILPGPNTNITIVSVQDTNTLGGVVSINTAGTALLYKPESLLQNNKQEPSFTYTISDGAGGLATATVLIKVQVGGFALVANEDIFTVMKNSSNALAVLKNDAILPNSGETLIVTDIGIGANAPNHGGAAGILGGQSLSYAPSNTFVGLETFTYEISDGTLTRAQGHVRVLVLDTALLRTSPDTFNVAQSSANNVLDVLRNDFALPRTSGAVTITSLDKTGLKGSVSLSSSAAGNFLFYSALPGFIGTERFGYTCIDRYGNTGSNTVTVVVGALTTQPDRFSVLSDSVGNQLDVLANDVPYPDVTTVRRISGLGSTDKGGTVAANADGSRVIYTPSAGYVGAEHFTYRISDDTGAIYTEAATVTVVRAGSDRDTNTVTITVIGVNDPPTITNSVPPPLITDKETGTPFANVTIADVDNRGKELQTVTVIIDNTAKGVLTNLGGFVQRQPGIYTISNIMPANVTAVIRGIIFVPTENRIIVPTTENTVFTILANDSHVTTTNFVEQPVRAVNDPPLLSGTVSGLRVYNRASIRPFYAVLITEVDDSRLQPLTIRVTFDGTHGFLTGLSGFVSNAPGSYVITNTAAAGTLALRDLLFVPTTSNRVVQGVSETTRFTISVEDGFAPAVIDNNTTVTAVAGLVARLQQAVRGISDSDDEYGVAVAATRDFVAVGQPQDDNNNETGSAYIYARQLDGSEAWTEAQRLYPPGGHNEDRFGFSIALSGDTLVVGAPNEDSRGSDAGAIYVFLRQPLPTNQWDSVVKVTAPDGLSSDSFGYSVAIDGDTIAVGAPGDDDRGSSSGSVYLFARNGTNWVLVRKVTASDGLFGDGLGSSISLSGDTLVAGAPGRDQSGSDSGAAYVFSRNQGGADQWGQVKKLLPNDPGSGDEFGFAVSVDKEIIAVGSPMNDDFGSDSGSAYVFAQNQGGINQWGQVKKLLPLDRSSFDNFGSAVSVDGDNIVVGSPDDNANGSGSGSAYLFLRNAGGANQWNQAEKFVPGTNSTDGHFGAALSVDHSTLVVGAPFESPNTGKYGSVYIYRLKYDNAPSVANPVPDQTGRPDEPFTLLLSPNTFSEADVSDTLTVTTGPLPAWLQFNPFTVTFTGTPTTGDVGVSVITITATDEDGLMVSDVFNLAVSISNPVLPPPTPLSVWRERSFGTHVMDPSEQATVWGNDADPDNDGRSNLAEYIYGSDPLNPVDVGIGLSISNDGPGQVRVSYNRRNNDPHLSYFLETSTDFVQWFTAQPLIGSEAIGALSYDFERVTATLISPLPNDASFFRVRAVYTP